MDNVKIVVPWYYQGQLENFIHEWKVSLDDDRFIFQQDKTKAGCGKTKNAGITRAVLNGADIVIVLDDDCYPDGMDVNGFILEHINALNPCPVTAFSQVTIPASRGTPYLDRSILMQVAASMGFWRGVGDYDAVGQLVHGPKRPMIFDQSPIHGRYFPLSGMNIAFRPVNWLPWCQFIDVPRFDDIWMGWLWQREAYRQGCCFNLSGPTVRHARQSNVWNNLIEEAKHLERNETLWRDIATNPSDDYETLRKLLPV